MIEKHAGGRRANYLPFFLGLLVGWSTLGVAVWWYVTDSGDGSKIAAVPSRSERGLYETDQALAPAERRQEPSSVNDISGIDVLCDFASNTPELRAVQPEVALSRLCDLLDGEAKNNRELGNKQAFGIKQAWGICTDLLKESPESRQPLLLAVISQQKMGKFSCPALFILLDSGKTVAAGASGHDAMPGGRVDARARTKAQGGKGKNESAPAVLCRYARKYHLDDPSADLDQSYLCQALHDAIEEVDTPTLDRAREICMQLAWLSPEKRKSYFDRIIYREESTDWSCPELDAIFEMGSAR